jgi:N4-(beta-N-acetylglucosaminyl)-L-asparaginase
MSSRRKFLKASVITGAAAVTGSKIFALPKKITTPELNNPIVISTWDFGKPANAAAWEVLKNGGKALNAVEAGVRIPEKGHSNQSVGYGGLPDRDGFVTLDACIMDHQYNCGSVMCLENIMHPISVARMVMEKTPHVILTGQGALEFALANGFKKENLLTEESKKDWQEWLKTSHYQPEVNVENKKAISKNDPMPGGIKNHDTIGMLAIDSLGNLSGACTTSGLAYKMHGRVGDSPVIGAGLYVDNEIGAATATGVGEEVIRIVGSHLIVELMRQGLSPEDACKAGVQRIIKISPEKSKNIQVGFLAINKKGEFGAYCLQKGFTYAVKNGKEETMYTAKSFY